MGFGFIFHLNCWMLAAFACESFALCGISDDAFDKVDLFCGTIYIGVTLDGLVGGMRNTGKCLWWLKK